ncbi:hypothetical protein JOL62DRAFT_642487 [Phyllosticta paracitricarpa]|uniref:Peptidase M43 pregnancy-associated plasma-A domain-containing protein n=2 Tax=Phyllosticta TaxID=121621 RepID=A0ABR1LBG9_9PEZI
MILLSHLFAIIALLTSSLVASEFTKCAPQDTPKEYYDGLARVIAYEQAVSSPDGASGVDGVQAMGDDESRPFIKVYFHIMWDWSDDFITDATFFKQFSILKDFFQPLGIDFKLVEMTVYAERVFAKGYDKSEMIRKFHRGPYSALNVFFTETIEGRHNIFGSSTLPMPDMTWNRAALYKDGVIISIRALPGFSLFSDYKAEMGKTLLHEVGHWMGLEHIYFNGCDPDFVNGGDHVEDTPPQADGISECFPEGTIIRTCPEDMFPNNLITNDQCMESLTPGQVARMKNMFWLMRHNTPSSPPPSAPKEPDQGPAAVSSQGS